MSSAPKLIALSEPFIKALEVDRKTAYALQPCFASSLDVYSAEAVADGFDAWVPFSILVGQRGQLYLFDPNDSRVVNAALLRRGAGLEGAPKTRVDIIVQDPPDEHTGTQSMFIRCRQPLNLNEILRSRSRNRGSPSPSHSKRQKQATQENPAEETEESKKGNESDNLNFPPFSYIFRFHCRHSPLALQFLRIIAHFADRTTDELMLRRTQEALTDQLRSTTIVDPGLHNTKSPSRHRRSPGASLASPFRRALSASGVRRQSGELSMRDVAKYEKRRLQSAGVRITIPPPPDPSSPLRPYVLPPFGSDGPNAASVPTREPSPNGAREWNRASAAGVDAPPSALLRLYERVHDEATSAVLPQADDILLQHDLPGFESQLALFFAQESMVRLVSEGVEQILSKHLKTPPEPQDRLMAREILREMIRFEFVSEYRSLCKTTKNRIESISIENLAIEAERAMMQRAHEQALQAIQEEFNARRAQQIHEEEHVFFGDNNELKSSETGQLIAPLGVEEERWRAEALRVAAELKEVERGIEELENHLLDFPNSEVKSPSHDLTWRSTSGGRVGVSIETEANELLQRIHEERDRYQSLTRLREQRIRGNSTSAVRNNEGGEEVERVRIRYNRWVLQQQEEIDSLRRDLLRSAARFGVDALWMEQQCLQRGLVTEILEGTGSEEV